MRTWIPLVCAAALGGCWFGSHSSDDGVDGGVGGHCTRTTDCSAGLVCAADVCTTEGSLGVGAMCSANRDCASGLYCALDGMCAVSGGGELGDACSSGADCKKNLVCELTGLGGTCVDGGGGDLGATCSTTRDCLAGLACSSGGKCERTSEAYPPFPGITCAADESPFRGFFEVPRTTHTPADFYRLPFPNDARVAADGSLDLHDFPRPGLSVLGVDVVDLYATALSQDFEGFSSIAPVTFRFSSPIDFTTVQDGSALHLADITDPLAAGYGVDVNRTFGFTTGRGKFVCQNALTMSNRMFEPLLPGRTYVAWISSALRSSAGAQPSQDPDLLAVLGATMPVDPDLSRAWTRYAKFRDYLQRTGRTAADVATAAVFTTADHSRIARALDAQVEAGPPPTLSQLTVCDGTAVSPCAGEDGRVCGDSSGSYWEVHGKLSIPNYQAGTLPYERPADGGAIMLDGGRGGAPVAQGTLDVCFALTIPKVAAPGTGWPLVVHAHGTGGSFKAAIDDGIAAALSTGGTQFATLTFDGVGHGARRGASTRSPDSLVFNIVNPRAARDNHLQGAVDVIQALRVASLTNVVVPPGAGGGPGTISFDPGKVYFFGHSQGSNVGIPALAVTDLTKGAILSGAGSVLIEGLMTKKSPVDAKQGLEYLLGETIGGGHPVMVLWQTFFDRIDPVNYAPMLIRRPPAGTASKHVLETWGKGDTYSPESTLNNTAIAAGLVTAQPVVTSIGTATDARPIQPQVVGGDGPIRFGALFQYDPAGMFDGHFVAQQSPAAMADWKAFLVSLSAGAPNVP